MRETTKRRGGQRCHGFHEPALHQWGQQAGKPQQKRGKVCAVPEKEVSDNMIKTDQ